MLKRVHEIIKHQKRFLERWKGHLIFVIDMHGYLADYADKICELEKHVHVRESTDTTLECGGFENFPIEASYEFRLVKVADLEDRLLGSDSKIFLEIDRSFRRHHFDVFLRELSHVHTTVVTLHQVDKLRSANSLPATKSNAAFPWLQTISSSESFTSPKASGQTEHDPPLFSANVIAQAESALDDIRKLPMASHVTFLDITAGKPSDAARLLYAALNISCAHH